MVVALKKLDPIGLHQVTQRFRLADADEGIAEHCLHVIQQPAGRSPVGADPVLQVLEEFRMTHGPDCRVTPRNFPSGFSQNRT